MLFALDTCKLVAITAFENGKRTQMQKFEMNIVWPKFYIKKLQTDFSS